MVKGCCRAEPGEYHRWISHLVASNGRSIDSQAGGDIVTTEKWRLQPTVVDALNRVVVLTLKRWFLSISANMLQNSRKA